MFFLARTFINLYLYKKTDPLATESLASPFKPDFEAMIFILFTFKFSIEIENEKSLYRIIKYVNRLHTLFIFYSIFTFILLLLTYGRDV